MLEVLHDQELPEREEMLEWMGDGFDAVRCDLEEVNADPRASGIGALPQGERGCGCNAPTLPTVAVREAVRPRLPQPRDRARTEM